MSRPIICDRCKRPCDRIVAKVFLAMKVPRVRSNRSDHNNYHLHADIGECCVSEVVKSTFKWTKRKKVGSNGKTASTATVGEGVNNKQVNSAGETERSIAERKPSTGEREDVAGKA